jgi:large subunit ribosomal protein L20
MSRATTGKVHHKRAKKILKDAKGYRGGRSKLYRTAKDARRRALENSFKHRRVKKRDFRTLWIVRIGAAARENGMNYSTFMHGLREAGIDLNRKVLADMAVRDREGFSRLVETIKKSA